MSKKVVETETRLLYLLIIMVAFSINLATVYSLPEFNISQPNISVTSHEIELTLYSDSSVFYQDTTETEIVSVNYEKPYVLLKQQFGKDGIDYDTIRAIDINSGEEFKRVPTLNESDCSGTYDIDFPERSIYFCIERGEKNRILISKSYLINALYPIDIKNGTLYRKIIINSFKSTTPYHAVLKSSYADDLVMNTSISEFCPPGWDLSLGDNYIVCETNDLPTSMVKSGKITAHLTATLKSHLKNEAIEKELKEEGKKNFFHLIILVSVFFLNFFIAVSNERFRKNVLDKILRHKWSSIFCIALTYLLVAIFSRKFNNFP